MRLENWWKYLGKLCQRFSLKYYHISSCPGSFSNESMKSTWFFFGSKTCERRYHTKAAGSCYEIYWILSLVQPPWIFPRQRYWDDNDELSLLVVLGSQSSSNRKGLEKVPTSLFPKNRSMFLQFVEGNHVRESKPYILTDIRNNLTGKSKSVESLTILGTGCEGTLPVNCCLDLQNGWTPASSRRICKVENETCRCSGVIHVCILSFV